MGQGEGVSKKTPSLYSILSSSGSALTTAGEGEDRCVTAFVKKINHSSEVRRNQALVFKIVFKQEWAMIDEGTRLAEKENEQSSYCIAGINPK